ncbi:MAG: lamin tail domain-containing protein, partial [bacterium]
MMIWDIDFAFASLGPTGDDMFSGIGRSNGIDLSEAAYRRRYWQILQDLANGPLVATKANPLITARYNAMVANGRTIDNPSSIQSYLSQRRNYLLGLITTNVPANFAITLNGGGDLSTNRNLIALTGTAQIDVRTITINGAVYPVTWTSVSNWTAQVALAGGTNALTIQGLDAQGNPVSGASTAINVNYTGAVEPSQDKLVINEIMYNPTVPNASFVEIYNTSSVNAFDLAGWELNGVNFTFPGGSVIAPGGFLVVAEDRVAFAQAYGGTIAVVGEFGGKLQNNGETLRLIKPGATPDQDLVVNQVRYDSQAPWPAAANGTGASLQL